ncbi:MAG: hypothetical protein AB7O68_14570 [Pirellulales bacterium]
MKEISSSNFGLVIAYLVPGATLLWGLAGYSPTLQNWLAATGNTPSIGGFLYVTLAALTAGLVVSTLRWAVVDTVHHATGIPRPPWNFAVLPKSVDAFGMLVEAHYRYYQFYANMCVALPIAYLAKRIEQPSVVSYSPVMDGGVLVLEIVLFAGSRDSLRKYYERAAPFLKTPWRGNRRS